MDETEVCMNCGSPEWSGKPCGSCGRSRHRLPHLAALPAACAIVAALAAGCGPSAPPAVFAPASCPVGQHVKMAPVGEYGPPGCVR